MSSLPPARSAANAAQLGAPAATSAAVVPLRRLTSADLMQDQRELEIEHAGRIYRLRITQLNKLILTA
jgi:hemin uptake protein HemP